MHFDWTITIGSILVVSGIVGSTVWSTGRIVSRVTTMISDIMHKLGEHDRWIKDHEECNRLQILALNEIRTKMENMGSDISYLRGSAEAGGHDRRAKEHH